MRRPSHHRGEPCLVFLDSGVTRAGRVQSVLRLLWGERRETSGYSCILKLHESHEVSHPVDKTDTGWKAELWEQPMSWGPTIFRWFPSASRMAHTVLEKKKTRRNTSVSEGAESVSNRRESLPWTKMSAKYQITQNTTICKTFIN